MTRPESDPTRHGVLVVDKPAGPTSHDIVDRVRRVLGERRVGHTGTLDPFATGVLVVCVGKATRLARFLALGDKVYRATVRLGFATDTDDLLGAPLGAPRPVHIEREVLDTAVRTLTGDLDQVPPAYSAKRVNGRRLYELAREGAIGARPPARVHVSALEVLAVRDEDVDLLVRCSPGTYVRALARDLGESLGVGGHLLALRRLASGGFTVDDAVHGDLLGDPSGALLKPLAGLLLDLPAVRLSAAGLAAVRHGRDVTRTEMTEDPSKRPPAPWWRLLDSEGGLVALAAPRASTEGVATLKADLLHPEIVLV
jgi:tRNA pseudouridine55 synthase